MLDFLLATSITERICGEPGIGAGRSAPTGRRCSKRSRSGICSCAALDDDGRWFRYHHLFAEFLQQRLERDHPERIRQLHRTACEWFAEHRLLSDAVDHALAADDEQRAVALVESRRHVPGRALADDHAARTGRQASPGPGGGAPTVAAGGGVGQHSAAPRGAREPGARPGRLPARARYAHRIRDRPICGSRPTWCGPSWSCAPTGPCGVDELVGPALSRPDTLPPFVVSVAANVATFGAVYRFDFDAARRLQDWAPTYHRQNNGPWNAVTGHCWVGVAASEQLDLHAAEDNFRKALRMARRSGGGHSHTARLAGSLLGVLLYERGEIAEAERLLDEGYKLGAEGGPVDFKLARYVVGSPDQGAARRSGRGRAPLDRGRADRREPVTSAIARRRRERADRVGAARRPRP